MDEERAESIAGTPWTESEVSAMVDSYFRMLATERAGVPYSKAENRRRLMATVRRSEGSIERKLQNISAVLAVLGAQWINGYKPLAHYRDALVTAVERSLGREPGYLYPASADTQPLVLNDEAIVAPPPPFVDLEQRCT